MKKFQSNSVKALAFSASAIAFAIAGPAYAQDAEEGQEEEEVEITEEGETASANQGGIVVTGSRIRRDTYTSISPIQVLNTEASQNVGLFDPSQILQRDESAAGTQIDATFQGFVLDNGPGSQTLNLRGLGADRTLLLINGRRLAPAGVEGAPTNPSINLIPGSLIERYDLLLDGASSVYGSDAVSGVGNIILRKDFDGLEMFARGEVNPQGAGEDYTISASYGLNTDRGFLGIGAEYDYRDAIRLKDRDFFDGCNTQYEVDQDGNIYTLGVRDNALVQNRTPGVSVAESECKIGGISGRIFQPFARFGSVYFPANGNIANIPGLGYGESTNAFGVDLDTDGDGVRDVDFQNVNTNGALPEQTFLSEQKLYNVMAYGEYTFPGDGNITPFFEANYSRAEIRATDTGYPQIFPSVPDLNQFNPCNFQGALNFSGLPNNGSGVDCRAADNALQGLTGSPFALSTGFALPTIPIASIRGDRNNTNVTQEQYRGVLGVKGDLPAFGSSWTWEVSGVYSRSEGLSIRNGIREDRLALSLGLDPTADYTFDGIVDNDGDGIADDYDLNLDVFGAFGDPQYIGECNTAGLANPDLAAPDLAQGCVPVNLFAPSVLTGAVGDFASAAERDYLFDQRRVDTTYEQMVFSAFVTGDLFELPAGPVSGVFGGEWRKDKISTDPNFQASNGLFFGFFADKGASGSKAIRELYGEVSIPLMAAKPMVEELTLDIAGRLTDEEFYGTNYTYSIKAGWRPVSSLLLRMTYGTSFRAPNLRENFLAGLSGFTGVFDPCAVPDVAFNSTAGGYDPSLDPRDQVVLDNCIREGRDPTAVGIDAEGLNTFQSASVEVTSGGSLDIDPETSRSLTAGFSFEETFGDGWDVALGATYFDIKLKESIVEPSAQFIVNDCFTRDDGQRSAFCDRISYETTGRLLVQDVFAGFLNLDQESVRGIDFNADFGKDVMLFGENIDLGINIRANHLMERSSLFTNDDGNVSFDDDAGEFGLPKWTGRTTFTADVSDFRLTYQIRYTGRVEQDETGIDPFADFQGFGPDGSFVGSPSDTCLGNGTANVPGDGRFCRDVGFADEQFLHTASIRYSADTWSLLVGVDNIFNTAPPLVDSSEVLAINNVAIGNGYDYDGREFFVSVSKQF
ncbi:TonB-dependent receptor [Altererythrobacter sp.]|uniref:TonB-dependent receptor domain-containing protein n=1 Tax=Altererythrobacter sp. TaxID=1872480 RepID=UPI001B05D488|nr:TonB-dependent receptor [Altererythrobacter sp.]MBO6608781.1 TonB-dependent receptor [Altererythrobacter sp.]MBO6640821.1 TonB-dependent receptor [Altererythrobacter sp.]MBO6708481.1 TonB-dependent receptor [Altererythrobacter sp.]